MANAYATLAADGKYCEPTPVQEITDKDGKKLDVANPRCTQAVDPTSPAPPIDAARCPVGDQSAYGKCAGRTAGDAPRRGRQAGRRQDRHDRRARSRPRWS